MRFIITDNLHSGSNSYIMKKWTPLNVKLFFFSATKYNNPSFIRIKSSEVDDLNSEYMQGQFCKLK